MSERHPFSDYVRALGRGPGLSRSLDTAEAETAMGMILDGLVEPEQLGAFLMLMRYKRETAEELAGFTRAMRARMTIPEDAQAPDLDWPSYADRHKQLPWFVLAALLLADNGVRVLMHGIAGEGGAYAPTGTALAALGVPACDSLSQAAARIESQGFAYLRLEGLAPRIAALFDLRPQFGLRSPVNSLARDINPLGAPAQMQGVFHPNFRRLHQDAAVLLGQPRTAIFKGGGGEAQRGPDKPVLVAGVANGAAFEEEWPALTPGSGYPWREEAAELARIPALWRGDYSEPAPTSAVVGTVAVALKTLGHVEGIGEAQRMAEEMWAARLRDKYPAAA